MPGRRCWPIPGLAGTPGRAGRKRTAGNLATGKRLKGESHADSPEPRPDAMLFLPSWEADFAARANAGRRDGGLDLEPFAPATGTTLGMHHGHDPDAVWLFQINDRVREGRREGALRRRMKTVKPLGIAADFPHQTLDFRVEALPQLNADSRVILDDFEILPDSVGMKDGGFHRLRIRLAWANTSSTGTP